MKKKNKKLRNLKTISEKMSAKEIIRKRNSGILVDQDTLRTGVLSKKYIVMDPNVWHAFVISCRQPMGRNQLLQIILDYVHPFDLVPLRFEALGPENSIFIARECSEAIQKICANNLLIPNPYDQMSPLSLEIILQYSSLNELRVSIPDRMKTLLFSLYNAHTKTLVLDSFCDNEGLLDYLPLSQPKILYHVLNGATSINPSVISLRNNRINSLNSQEVLWKYSSLTRLDLRNNKIEDISALTCLKDMKLMQIDLDGNPICGKMDAYSYVTELKNILPSLQMIDGEQVLRDGVPAFRRNFLCDNEGFAVVNKFIEMFFLLYDKDRKALEQMYHPKAFCSLTNLYKTGQTTSHEARLRPYQINCRNILAMADISRSHQYLISGNQQIIRKFGDLPQVEHDPFSFSVDLVYYTEKVAIINVCGVFREHPESILDSERHLGFMRSFTLTSYNGEYLITNDMLHVYNALSHQVTKSFRISRPITDGRLPPPKTFRDKAKAIEAFELITGLTNEWSKSYLEESGYNMMESVKRFMDLYKVDKIPQVAFKK